MVLLLIVFYGENTGSLLLRDRRLGVDNSITDMAYPKGTAIWGFTNQFLLYLKTPVALPGNKRTTHQAHSKKMYSMKCVQSDELQILAAGRCWLGDGEPETMSSGGNNNVRVRQSPTCVVSSA